MEDRSREARRAWAGGFFLSGKKEGLCGLGFLRFLEKERVYVRVKGLDFMGLGMLGKGSLF